jgi:hypothetical protein
MYHQTIDTAGLLDKCSCGARAKFICESNNELQWRVGCTECAEITGWCFDRSRACEAWNYMRRSRDKVKVQVIVELPKLDFCNEAVCAFCSVVLSEAKCVLFGEPLDDETNEPCDRCKAVKRAAKDMAIQRAVMNERGIDG